MFFANISCCVDTLKRYDDAIDESIQFAAPVLELGDTITSVKKQLSELGQAQPAVLETEAESEEKTIAKRSATAFSIGVNTAAKTIKHLMALSAKTSLLRRVFESITAVFIAELLRREKASESGFYQEMKLLKMSEENGDNDSLSKLATDILALYDDIDQAFFTKKVTRESIGLHRMVNDYSDKGLIRVILMFLDSEDVATHPVRLHEGRFAKFMRQFRMNKFNSRFLDSFPLPFKLVELSKNKRKGVVESADANEGAKRIVFDNKAFCQNPLSFFGSMQRVSRRELLSIFSNPPEDMTVWHIFYSVYEHFFI